MASRFDRGTAGKEELVVRFERRSGAGALWVGETCPVFARWRVGVGARLWEAPSLPPRLRWKHFVVRGEEIVEGGPRLARMLFLRRPRRGRSSPPGVAVGRPRLPCIPADV